MDNKMFCFQCEQTAGCKACTGAQGVCGKKADTAQLQDELTGALAALTTLLLLGVLTPTEALAGFSSPIVIMMIGLFVVGGAIMQTGLARLTGK